MDLDLYPDLDATFYNERVQDWQARAIEREKALMESEDIDHIKQVLFPAVMSAHRELVTAEARWHLAIIRDMKRRAEEAKTKKNPLLFWK